MADILKKLLFASVFFFSITAPASAFWVWTPETNKWINPKYDVKDTPEKQLKVVEDLYQTKDYDKAVQESRKLLKHYPKSREAADAQFYIAECMYQTGKFFKAFQEYQTVIDKYPFTGRSAQIVSRQYEIANQLLEGHGGPNGLIGTIAGSDYDVVEVLRTVIRNSPYGEYAAPAQYKIGLYLQEKDMFQEARDEFEKTMNDYPGSKWAEAAKYQIALSDAKRSAGPQYNQAVTKSAVEEFKNFVADNPDAEFSQGAHKEIQNLMEKEAENTFVIAEFYEKQKQYEAARIYYSHIVERYPNTTWVTKSLEKLQELNQKQ